MKQKSLFYLPFIIERLGNCNYFASQDSHRTEEKQSTEYPAEKINSASDFPKQVRKYNNYTN